MSETKNKLQKIKNYDWRKLSFELLVVFLGVTAGFLLNNWQMQKKDENLEKQYLNAFLQDVKSNIIEFRKAISADSLWIEQVKPKLLVMKDGSLPIDSANILIKQIIGISKINIQKGTYEDIKNSGNLNLLHNFELKKQIVDYHVEISNLEFIDDYFYNFFNDFVMPFVFAHYNILKEKIIDPRILQSNKFDNAITGYFAMVQQRKKAYDELLQQSYSLQNRLIQIE